MSKTIGNHRPTRSPMGDYVTLCDYCGTAHYRSDLYRDDAGKLVCPDEGMGLDVIALERANQDMTPKTIYTSKHDGTDDPPNTDTAPDMAALTDAPSGGNP